MTALYDWALEEQASMWSRLIDDDPDVRQIAWTRLARFAWLLIPSMALVELVL